MHWIGLIPKQRWGDDNGMGVLPLARYLNSLGVIFDSTPANSNTQGHTPNHKAAWGGNLALLQYFRDEHGVYDTVQDTAGNFCADLAKMGGKMDCYNWLLEHGNGERAESYRALGLDMGADMDAVRSRFMELAKKCHPDKSSRQDGNQDECFVRIKAAYEHLAEGGFGKQKNPKFDELKLIENHRLDSPSGPEEQDDLFIARLIAVLSDYGDDGFPVSLIARRWNQIWPDRPFPQEYVITRTVKRSKKGEKPGTMVLQKKVKLLKWLKWKTKHSKVYFRNIDGDVLAFEYKDREHEKNNEKDSGPPCPTLSIM